MASCRCAKGCLYDPLVLFCAPGLLGDLRAGLSPEVFTRLGHERGTLSRLERDQIVLALYGSSAVSVTPTADDKLKDGAFLQSLTGTDCSTKPSGASMDFLHRSGYRQTKRALIIRSRSFSETAHFMTVLSSAAAWSTPLPRKHFLTCSARSAFWIKPPLTENKIAGKSTIKKADFCRLFL